MWEGNGQDVQPQAQQQPKIEEDGGGGGDDEDDFGDDFDEFAEEGDDFGDFDEADETPVAPAPAPVTQAPPPDVLGDLVSSSPYPQSHTTLISYSLPSICLHANRPPKSNQPSSPTSPPSSQIPNRSHLNPTYQL